MKHIKNLGITTQEGFSVKNLQRFPSMEWGDEGGLQAELYYNGKEIMTVYQEGNGGGALTYLTDYGRDNEKELKKLGLIFLKRVDVDYGENSEYDWLKNKTAENFYDDDWEQVVLHIENRYDLVKHYKSLLKKGYNSGAEIVYKDGKSTFLSTGYAYLSKNQVIEHLKKENEYNGVEFIDILNIQTDLKLY